MNTCKRAQEQPNSMHHPIPGPAQEGTAAVVDPFLPKNVFAVVTFVRSLKIFNSIFFSSLSVESARVRLMPRDEWGVPSRGLTFATTDGSSAVNACEACDCMCSLVRVCILDLDNTNAHLALHHTCTVL